VYKSGKSRAESQCHRASKIFDKCFRGTIIVTLFHQVALTIQAVKSPLMSIASDILFSIRDYQRCRKLGYLVFCVARNVACYVRHRKYILCSRSIRHTFPKVPESRLKLAASPFANAFAHAYRKPSGRMICIRTLEIYFIHSRVFSVNSTRWNFHRIIGANYGHCGIESLSTAFQRRELPCEF